MSPEYLTLDEGAKLLRFDVTAPKCVREAFRQYLRGHAIPVKRRGRVILIEKRVLEATLDDGR